MPNKEYRLKNKDRLREMDRRYREKNKERLKVWCKDYYQKNKEKCKKYRVEYNQKNRDIILKKCKEYYNKNKDRILEQHRLNRLDGKYGNRRMLWCKSTIAGHLKRGYTINLSLTELMNLSFKSDRCPYCGMEFAWDKPKKVGKNHDSPTMDRIYNQNTLQLDNIEIICHRCNLSKSNFTRNEFIDYCKKVSTRLF